MLIFLRFIFIKDRSFISFNNFNTLRDYNNFYLYYNEQRKRIRIKIIIFILNYNNIRQFTYINYSSP